MKKALSLILAIMMVFALSTTAFAAYDNTDRVVGQKGQGINNGLTEGTFANNPTGTTLAITANAGDIEHRYAVDIDYDTLAFEVDGDALVWDVNDLKYVQSGSAEPLSDTVFKLEITNRSDLPINLKASIQDKVDDATDGLTLGLYKGHISSAADVATATALLDVEPIEKAKVGDAEEFQFCLVATASEWTDVTNYYMNAIAASGDSKTTIATLNITISK